MISLETHRVSTYTSNILSAFEPPGLVQHCNKHVPQDQPWRKTTTGAIHRLYTTFGHFGAPIIRSIHPAAFDFTFRFRISESTMRPPKLEHLRSKCDACAHFPLTACHIAPKILIINARLIRGRSLFAYKQVIPIYIYGKKNLKYDISLQQSRILQK